MATIKPFTITVPQAKLDDLRARLTKTIWPSTIEGQSYGGPELARMQDLTRRTLAFDQVTSSSASTGRWIRR